MMVVVAMLVMIKVNLFGTMGVSASSSGSSAHATFVPGGGCGTTKEIRRVDEVPDVSVGDQDLECVISMDKVRSEDVALLALKAPELAVVAYTFFPCSRRMMPTWINSPVRKSIMKNMF